VSEPLYIEVGVCGEHGGDPQVHLLVDHVSVLPLRAPLARLVSKLQYCRANNALTKTVLKPRQFYTHVDEA